jgi:hypothetical protein
MYSRSFCEDPTLAIQVGEKDDQIFDDDTAAIRQGLELIAMTTRA